MQGPWSWDEVGKELACQSSLGKHGLARGVGPMKTGVHNPLHKGARSHGPWPLWLSRIHLFPPWPCDPSSCPVHSVQTPTQWPAGPRQGAQAWRWSRLCRHGGRLWAMAFILALLKAQLDLVLGRRWNLENSGIWLHADKCHSCPMQVSENPFHDTARSPLPLATGGDAASSPRITLCVA